MAEHQYSLKCAVSIRRYMWIHLAGYTPIVRGQKHSKMNFQIQLTRQ